MSSSRSSSKSSSSRSSSVRRNAQHKFDIRKLVLTKMEKSSSVPSIKEIEKIQIMKFTVEEVKHMCSDDDIVTSIMSTILKIDIRQLKKFCKYLNTFLENPNKSPANIRDEMIKVKNKTKLSHLPEDAIEVILSKYKEIIPRKMVLRDWVYKLKIKLDWKELVKNENAIDYMKDNIDKVKFSQLRIGIKDDPKFKDLLNELYKRTDLSGKTLSYLARNENAIDIIEDKIKNNDFTDWSDLSYNRNPRAIKLIEEELKNPNNKIDWIGLSLNPAAIKLIEEELKKQNSKVSWQYLSQNENAMHIIENEFEKENSKVNWTFLSLNKNAIPLITKVLERDPNDIRIQWGPLSINPNAIDILKRYFHNINVHNLMNNSSNRVIEIIVRNNRLQDQFIDWYNLIQGKHIKYVWDNFREETINKLRSGIEDDEDMLYLLAMNEYGIDCIEYFYDNNLIPNEILDDSHFWYLLSLNRNAMSILEKNKDKIDWSGLSANPAIFVRDKVE